MDINICNFTPEDIMKLLKKFDTLHRSHSITPITLSFEFYDITEPDENNELEVFNYDFFDNKNNHAEIDLDDASLEFDDVKIGKKYLIVNDKLYKYREYQRKKYKNG